MQTKNNVFLSIFSSIMDWTSDGNNNSKEVYMLQIIFLTLYVIGDNIYVSEYRSRS